MEREQYAIMARREERHWWYTGMRKVALAVLDAYLSDQPGLRLLDAGCGTGGTTVALRRFGEVVGVDLAWEALGPARARGLRLLSRGSVEALPFASRAFDVVTSFEVVYHLGVGNDACAFEEFHRVLKPGGLLLLRLPGHDWLRGEHDRLVHTRHRYTPSEIRTKLTAAGFRLETLTWANSVLFPPAVAKRLMERGESAEAEPDLWQPPELLNAVLESAIAVEALAIPRGISLPFGLSVLAVARAE
jgi:SAM-dependent methyltransferase